MTDTSSLSLPDITYIGLQTETSGCWRSATWSTFSFISLLFSSPSVKWVVTLNPTLPAIENTNNSESNNITLGPLHFVCAQPVVREDLLCTNSICPHFWFKWKYIRGKEIIIKSTENTNSRYSDTKHLCRKCLVHYWKNKLGGGEKPKKPYPCKLSDKCLDILLKSCKSYWEIVLHNLANHASMSAILGCCDQRSQYSEMKRTVLTRCFKKVS